MYKWILKKREYWTKGNILGQFGRQMSGQPMIFPFVQYSLIHDLAQRVHRWIQVVNCQKAIKPTILAVAPSIYINRLWVLDMYLDIRCLFGNRMSDLYSNSYQMIISDIHRRSIWLWKHYSNFQTCLVDCLTSHKHSFGLQLIILYLVK